MVFGRRNCGRALVGAGLAAGGAVFLELLIHAGIHPLAPFGWPGVGTILGAAFGGFPGFLGGAAVVAGYHAINLEYPARFPAFYANIGLAWIWLLGLFAVGLITALLRNRLDALGEAKARAEVSLAQLEDDARFVAVTENVGALVSYVDSDKRFRFNNKLYEEWLGVERVRITGHLVSEVLGQEAYAKLEPFVERALAGERVEFDTELLRGDSVRHIHGVYVPDISEGKVHGFHGIVSDIGRLKEAERRLVLLAHYDSLTGLANRGLFMDTVSLALARSRRQKTLPALMYLDIDHFKSINDSLGHGAGDAVLREFAMRLRRNVREADLPARLGGDEFMILLEDVKDAANVERVAQKILDAMRANVVAEGCEIEVSLSIGIAVHDGRLDADGWMKRADAALYAAKGAGRKTFRTG